MSGETHIDGKNMGMGDQQPKLLEPLIPKA